MNVTPVLRLFVRASAIVSWTGTCGMHRILRFANDRLEPAGRSSGAMLLMSAGEMSKAKSLSLSHGLADLNDPMFLQQMKAKHGKASVPVASSLAAHGPAGSADIQMPSIMEAVRVLRKNKHPGPGGFRDEFMNVLADESAMECDRLKNGLDAHAKSHVQADLPDWHYLMGHSSGFIWGVCQWSACEGAPHRHRCLVASAN